MIYIKYMNNIQIQKVTRNICCSCNGNLLFSHFSVISCWLVLLLKVSTQHPLSSGHGVVFFSNCTFLVIHICNHIILVAALPQEQMDCEPVKGDFYQYQYYHVNTLSISRLRKYIWFNSQSIFVYGDCSN